MTHPDHGAMVWSGSSWQGPAGAPAAPARMRSSLSVALIAVTVIGVVVAGLLAAEIYARHRAGRALGAGVACAVQDTATVSFGATPFLLQHVTRHYRHISIRTAGNKIRDARGMKADLRIDDVRLKDGDTTIGTLSATITWPTDGIRQTVQAIPLIGQFVIGVQASPEDASVELQGGFGSVEIAPRVADGAVALRVVDVTGLGLLVPSDVVQSALDDFTTDLAESYPQGIHADSVRVTDDGVTAHYSARNASIHQGGDASGVDRESGDNRVACVA